MNDKQFSTIDHIGSVIRLTRTNNHRITFSSPEEAIHFINSNNIMVNDPPLPEPYKQLINKSLIVRKPKTMMEEIK